MLGAGAVHINKTAIIILTYNNLSYNKDCLESIKRYTEAGAYEIIVVDNCSTDGTREWLESQTDIKVLLNDFNAGFPKGCNMGIGLAEPESDILLLNNDTVVTSNWLKNLQACLYSEESIGAVGAVCNNNENLQGLNLSYTDFAQMQQLAARNNVSDSGRWEEKIFLIGFCVLIKRGVLEQIGLLDEAYTPGYVEDNDLSIRIITAGYRLMLCHDCFIHHYLGLQFRKDLSKFYTILYKNRELFKNKWGFETVAFDELKYGSLNLLCEKDKPEKIRILEIGCGIGATLLKLKRECANAELYGLEPDGNMAAISRHIASVSTELDFPEGFFDYIFMGNLLERTENPELLIKELKKHLKDGGYLIGEVQNIMHYGALSSLLGGKWYTAEGVPNKKNRSFFALDDIHRLFSDCQMTEPFIFHWFSVPTEEEKGFINKLVEIGDIRGYLYTTYMFSFRFRK